MKHLEAGGEVSEDLKDRRVQEACSLTHNKLEKRNYIMAITQVSNLPQQYKQDLQQGLCKTTNWLDIRSFRYIKICTNGCSTRCFTNTSSITCWLRCGCLPTLFNTSRNLRNTSGYNNGWSITLHFWSSSFNRYGAGTGAGSIASYMSPYQSQVIDASLAEFDRQAA